MMARYMSSECARRDDTAEQWWPALAGEVPTLAHRSVYCGAYQIFFFSIT